MSYSLFFLLYFYLCPDTHENHVFLYLHFKNVRFSLFIWRTFLMLFLNWWKGKKIARYIHMSRVIHVSCKRLESGISNIMIFLANKSHHYLTNSWNGCFEILALMDLMEWEIYFMNIITKIGVVKNTQNVGSLIKARFYKLIFHFSLWPFSKWPVQRNEN